jgi:hypothetical protein
VPFAGNTHDLQNRRSDVGAWFMQTAGKVNPRGNQAQTTQGFYVVAADGSAYGFNNNRSVERVLDFLQKGFDAFHASPPLKAEIPEPKDVIRRPPPGSAVVRVYSRIIPTPAGSHPSNENLQRDHLWILPEELAELQSGRMPSSLATRLCRFTFVDAVRGEPDFWRREEVLASKFEVARAEGDTVRLGGSFEMSTADQGRQVKGQFTAQLQVRNGRLVSFKGYAEATARGRSTYTPNPPAGDFPLKFAFILPPSGKDVVSPQAAFYGEEYLGRGIQGK